MAGIARLILLLMAGLMAAAGAASANDWKVYRYPDDGFAAEFPGVPKFFDMKPPQQQFVRGVQYLAKDDSGTEYLGQALLYQKFAAPRTHRVAQIPHRYAMRNFSLRRLDSACVLCYVRRIPAR